MDFKKEIEEPLENQGWKLDFIYLDDGTNRFQVTKPDIDLIDYDKWKMVLFLLFQKILIRINGELIKNSK